ncbi:MAG: DUF4234 domain-containing protein [Clostridia bacterium]|nr:DUF4234 domain-containing protein [Clostridia bacterium]
MNKKTLGISTIVLAALTLILSAMDYFIDINLFRSIAPVFFIATIVCGYLAFHEDTAFAGKWTWVVIIVLLSEMIFVPFLRILDFDNHGLNILGMIVTLLFVLSWACVLASVLFKKLFKLMPIGFAALALVSVVSAIANKYFDFFTFLHIATYVLFALISFGILPKLNTYFRWAVIVLLLLSFLDSLFLFIALLTLVILLVPFKRFGFAVRKLLALLLVVVAVLTILTTFASNPFGTAIREEIKENEAEIASLEEKIEAFDKFTHFEHDYSYYWGSSDILEWNDYKDEMKRTEFDKAIELVEQAMEDEGMTVYSTSHSLELDEDDFYSVREELPGNLAYCIANQKQLSDMYTSTVVEGVLALIMMLIVVAGLICLAVCLFKNKYGMLAMLSCAMMGFATLLYMFISTDSRAYFSFDILNYTIFDFLASPYLWSGVVIAMFAVIFAGKYQKLIKFRVIAIIAAVITVLIGVSGFSSNPLSHVALSLYAVTMICISFILVPCVFTEYNGIGKHIFFSIITLGIWNLIWTYNVTKNLNKVASVEDRKPVKELLLCIFLPLYNVYWIYKTAENVEAYGEENSKSFKISVLCLVFAIFMPLLSTVLIQDKINKIVGKPE